MRLYPLMVSMEDRSVAIVGGGKVALRKAEDLLEAGARVTIIAPEIASGFDVLKKEYNDRIKIICGEYKNGVLEGHSLVFSATGDPGVNEAVYAEADKKNIFINAADDPGNCSFVVPSFARRGDLILSLSTGGVSPALAARLRRELEKYLPENIEEILTALFRIREALKKDKAFSHLDSRGRGEVLKRIVTDDTLLNEACASFKENRLTVFLNRLR